MCESGLDSAARPDGARRGRYVSSNRDISTERKRTDGLLAVQYDDKVGDVRTDLQAPADAARRDTRRRRPGAVGEARDDEA